jgi:hypothetical protein
VSVEFELRRLSLGAEDVRGLVFAWLTAEQAAAEVFGAQPDFAHVFVPGASIRGFSLRGWRASLRNRIEVQLNVCASRADWSAAYSFLRFARDRGYTVQSQEGVLSTASLVEEQALQQARVQFVADVRYLWKMLPSPEDERIELPIDRFTVPIGRHELPPEPLGERSLEVFEQAVQERAGRYALARSAKAITLSTGASAVVWSGEPMLTPLVDYIILTPDLDPALGVYLRWGRVVSELPGGVENTRLSPPQYFFGGVTRDGKPWTTLVDAGAPMDAIGQATR